MGEKMDRRVRKTQAQLRAGLARLMEQKKIQEITVKELVEKVDINRSTFYLHYADIYQMLESIEQDLMTDIENAIEAHPLDPLHKASYPFIAELFGILDKNRDICKALLGVNGDIAFVNKIETFLADNIMKQMSVEETGKRKQDLEYAYAFCLNGCVGMVKTWLLMDRKESPEHMAELTYLLVDNTVHHFLKHQGNL